MKPLAALTLDTARLHPFELRRPRVISLIRPGNRRSIALAGALGETLHSRTELLGADVLVSEKLR